MRTLALILVVLALGVEGCRWISTPGDRLKEKIAARYAAWQAESGNEGKQPTKEIYEKWQAEAETELARERAADKAEASKQAAEAVGHLATGNWVAGGLGLLGSVMLFFGVKFKREEMALKKKELEVIVEKLPATEGGSTP